MSFTRVLSAAGSALLIGATFMACSSTSETTEAGGVTRQYGPAQNVGNGTVRTYLVVDKNDSSTPIEIGVAMSETAMNNLPAGVASTDPMANMHMYTLVLPTQNPTPYKFVQFDWNPVGHEPAGVYDLPHFDFHFYTVATAVRDGILPTDPQYATKAANFPTTDFRAPFYVDAATAANAPAAAASVPQMGLHWLDARSPELQALTGHPENVKAFTKTFIYGSWNGAFIFDEPMITRSYLMAKHDATDASVRDEIIAVPTALHYSPAGFYPGAYRITYDPTAKEYRVALTQLAQHN
jgi:hypothetical protein